MKKVLFVCTGNVFRSMSAELCLKDYIKRNNIKEMKVSSAGTSEKMASGIDKAVKKTLNEYGILTNSHKKRQLTKKIIENKDIIIAMAKNHQKYIKEKFNLNVPLFNEIIKENNKSIKDLGEAIKDPKTHSKESNDYLIKTVRYIHDNIPILYKEIK